MSKKQELLEKREGLEPKFKYYDKVTITTDSEGKFYQGTEWYVKDWFRYPSSNKIVLNSYRFGKYGDNPEPTDDIKKYKNKINVKYKLIHAITGEDMWKRIKEKNLELSKDTDE